MSAESLAKARQRKKEIALERDAEALQAIVAYHEWLVQEREAFDLRNRYAQTVGRNSTDFILADMIWRETIKEIPRNLPSNNTWRRLEGRYNEEDES